MIAVYLFLVSSILLCNEVSSGPVWNLIHDFVQWNVAGIPTIHEKTTWDLDPDAGKQKRIEYEMLNGRLGSDAIARLGQSVDSAVYY